MVGDGGSFRIEGATDAAGELVTVTVGADGRLGQAGDPVDRVVDGSDMTVEPGFVDIQVNGGFGHDFTAHPGAIWEVAARLPEHGVTTFQPTLISPTIAEARAADAVLSAGPPEGWVGAIPLGLHLEGPALNPVQGGAHPADRLAEPTEALVGEWLGLEHLRIVTLAPELPGALAAIDRMVEAGVVASIGHTAATAAQVTAAADAGAAMVTHLFNAMAPFHHRDPGPVGAALTDDRLSIGLIADGVHVAPEALDLAWRAAGPDRIILTTDAIAGLGAGTDPTRTEDETLQGGTVPFHDVRRTFLRSVGRTDRSGATSAPRRRSLGLGVCSANALRTLGRRSPPGPGADDLVVLDGDDRPVLVVVGGIRAVVDAELA